jgi:hypothetical protein
MLTNLTNKRPDALIDSAINAAVALAKTDWEPLSYEGEFPVAGFGISEIRPYHIENTTDNIPQTSNLNYWQTSQVTASTWKTWIDVTMDQDQYLVVTGVFYNEADPLITELHPIANGVDLPVINIEQAFNETTGKIYFSKPFIVKPRNKLTIKAYARLGAGTTVSQRIGLMGYCIAKRPRLITES